MMKNNGIEIRNEAGECLVRIEGVIGAGTGGADAASYEAFRRRVAQVGEVKARRVVVEIRSTGGDVNDALLIYEALRGLDAEVVTRCYGYTASAATLIAQAASPGRREVAEGSLYLIHNAQCAAEGNAAELEAHADLLRKTDERLAALYAERSGRGAEEFRALMARNNGAGRWLSPEEAVAAGLADAVCKGAPKVRNRLSGRWERMLARLGLARPAATALPAAAAAQRLPLRTPSAEERAETARRAAGPTAVGACEDPSVGDVRRSANEAAYAADALRMNEIC